MGPLAVQDLSGIDIGHNARSAQPFPTEDPGYFRAAATMVEAGRLGRKTQAGFYRYDENGKAQADTQVDEMLAAKSASLGIKRRLFDADEIVHRALFALISEGLALLEAGIVQRQSDIDVIWLHGYGFPRHKGGPMFQAEQLGDVPVASALADLQHQYGEAIWPISEVEFD
jgi:3-hydroxyacyl-CoA dehydrogenase